MSRTLSTEDALNLRLLVDVNEKILKPGRKSINDRAEALGEGSGKTKEIIKVLGKSLEELEDAVIGEMLEIADSVGLVRLACEVPGTQKLDVMSFLAYVPYPEEFPTVSALWRYVGVDPTGRDGRYNPSARAALYRIADRLISENEAYHELYIEYHRKYSMRDWDTGHVNIASKRVVAKTWLAHLHEVARLLVGKEPGLSKAIDSHGEGNVHRKENYGWPELEQ